MVVTDLINKFIDMGAVTCMSRRLSALSDLIATSKLIKNYLLKSTLMM